MKKHSLEKTTVIQKDFPEDENQINLQNQKKEEEEEKNQQENEQKVQEDHKQDLEEDEEEEKDKSLSDVYSIPDIPPKPGFQIYQ